MTNDAGYYEANLLIAGSYRVALEKAGFRKSIRSGIVLPVSARVEINFMLQVGDVAETVSVTGEAPLVDTGAVAAAGRVMDTREVLDLPTFNNSPLMLLKLAGALCRSTRRKPCSCA